MSLYIYRNSDIRGYDGEYYYSFSIAYDGFRIGIMVWTLLYFTITLNGGELWHFRETERQNHKRIKRNNDILMAVTR